MLDNVIKKVASKRIARFIITGGFAFLVEYLAFIMLFYVVDINLSISNVFSFMLGLLTSYMLNRVWVFNSSSKVHKQFVFYLFLAILNLIISTVLINIFSNFLEPAIAKVGVVILIATWNYFIYKMYIFR